MTNVVEFPAPKPRAEPSEQTPDCLTMEDVLILDEGLPIVLDRLNGGAGVLTLRRQFNQEEIAYIPIQPGNKLGSVANAAGLAHVLTLYRVCQQLSEALQKDAYRLTAQENKALAEATAALLSIDTMMGKIAAHLKLEL